MGLRMRGSRVTRSVPSAFARPLERRVTADIHTWFLQSGRYDCAVGKLHYISFKLGMCLTGLKVDVKNKKKAFIYRPCAFKMRRAVNFLYYLNRNNTKEIIPVLLVF
jgi:hypothetical protein